MDFQCPPTPNCVSSEACAPHQKIAPFPIKGDPDTCWSALTDILTNTPQLKLKHQDAQRLHAVATTKLLRFKDDLYFERRTDHIAVKSASRLGYSDLGANRRRLESMRIRYIAALEGQV